MALKNIIGQDRPVHILKGCMAKDRIPHALLFTGDEGIGKRLTAFNFAKALNCLKTESIDLFSIQTEKDPDMPETAHADACDACPSCNRIEKGNHPDIFIIGPAGDGGQITVPAIRQLEESLSYKPFEGTWKIAIIDNADRLNPSAANAFLQTLEEPSPQSIVILISSRPDMLLPTIRSRCQQILFSPLPVDRMSRLLQDTFGQADEKQTGLLSVLSGGRLGYAMDEGLIDRRDRALRTFTRMISSGEEDVWDDKDAMEDWFDWCQLLLRDMAVFKATANTALLINQDKAEQIKAASRGAGLRDILKLARELYNIRRKLTFNLNKQLTFNMVQLLLRTNLGQEKDSIA